MINPRRRLSAALTAVVCLGLVACGGTQQAAPRTTGGPATCRPTTVKIGIPVSPPNVVHLPAYVANDLGYFQKEHLTPQFLTFESGVASFRAMAGGSVDVAGTALESLITAVAQGADARLVSSYQVGVDFVFVVGPSIHTLADLKGKRVNIEQPGAIADAMSRFVLQKAGIDPSQVQFISTSTAGRVPALINGQSDTGVLHYDQALIVMQKDPQLHILLNLADELKDYQFGAWAMSQQFLRSQPQTAECILRALIRGNRAMYDPSLRQRIVQIGVKYTKEPESVVSQTIQALASARVWPQNVGVDRTDVQGTIKSMEQRGLVQSPPSYGQLVDTSIATRVVNQLGRKNFPY
ncbi:MAG TPA: ABC transporter substrate-binding protein [Candidatus Dormibacteraeota bacterium]|jgi:NitT/TauT family transport system substrate-binding protein|nr:ABC transporter substrate-binding protein [Candidatus Dormibacteraeota bacterium]